MSQLCTSANPQCQVQPALRPSFRRVLCTLAALTVAFALAGCAGPGPSATPSDEGEPAVTATPTLLVSHQLQLPVERYLPAPADLLTIAQARTRLVNDCLARFGLPDRLPDPALDAFGPRSVMDRRYGITDPDIATTFAYGLGARDPRKQEKPAASELGPEAQTVLSGDGPNVVRGIAVPPAGCMSEAEDRVGDKDAAAKREAPQALQFRTFEQSKKDSRVRSAFTLWAACMEKRGLHYSDPLSIIGDPRFSEGQVSKESLAAAAADIECKRSSNVVGTWFAVESAYQTSAIKADPDPYDTAVAATARQLAVAKKILG